MPHLKSPKNQNRRAALGRPAIKITGGLEPVCGRPTLALASALVHPVQQLGTRKTKQIRHKRKAKWAAGIGGQVATMLELHTRQIDTTTIKRARKKTKKSNLEETKQKCRLGTASKEITGGLQLVCGRPTLALSSALVCVLENSTKLHHPLCMVFCMSLHRIFFSCFRLKC